MWSTSNYELNRNLENEFRRRREPTISISKKHEKIKVRTTNSKRYKRLREYKPEYYINYVRNNFELFLGIRELVLENYREETYEIDSDEIDDEIKDAQ
jgi:hypothetical protein